MRRITRTLKVYGPVDPKMEARRKQIESERGPLRRPHAAPVKTSVRDKIS